jgi:hypothetical protein
MKATKTSTLFALTAILLTTTGTATASNDEAADLRQTPAKIFIIDDQTGEELARDHGIQPITIDDFKRLVDGIVQLRRPAQLFLEAVDEDASDNPTVSLTFDVFAMAPPPIPSRNTPLTQRQEVINQYQRSRELWREKFRQHGFKMLTRAEGFVSDATDLQMRVAARFDEMLAANNGKDFNRSDILGTILNANRFLGTEGARYIILNTDCVDHPGSETGRKSHSAPLTSEQLDPGIHLIWANRSNLPQRQPFFKGIPNPQQHLRSVQEAFEAVVIDLQGNQIAKGQ